MSTAAGPNVYRNVLLSLLVLTVLTVAVSRVPMGDVGNIIVGVLIAVIKASLVVLFFMHMKYEQRWWAGIILFPLALVMIIIFSNFPDTALNGYEKGSDWGFTTPAEKTIPRAGGGGPAH